MALGTHARAKRWAGRQTPNAIITVYEIVTKRDRPRLYPSLLNMLDEEQPLCCRSMYYVKL